MDCLRARAVDSVADCNAKMGEVKEGEMGDYVSVKCENCKQEVTAVFFEDIEKPIEITIPLCEECFEGGHCPDCTVGYDEGYDNGYEAGAVEGESR